MIAPRITPVRNDAIDMNVPDGRDGLRPETATVARASAQGHSRRGDEDRAARGEERCRLPLSPAATPADSTPQVPAANHKALATPKLQWAALVLGFGVLGVRWPLELEGLGSDTPRITRTVHYSPRSMQIGSIDAARRAGM